MKTIHFYFLLCASMLSASAGVWAQNGRPQESLNNPRVKQLYALAPEAYVPDKLIYETQWPHMPESNILWARRVWRTIDIRNDGNSHLKQLRSDAATLASVLVDGVMNDRYKVYHGSDQRFTVALDRDSFVKVLNSGIANSYLKFNPAACTRYWIKEDWLYLAAEKKLVVRIIGIAPLREVRNTAGEVKDEPVFWLYYVPVRPYLREFELVDKIDGRVRNLDQVFETREFVSKVDSAGAFKSKWGWVPPMANGR